MLLGCCHCGEYVPPSESSTPSSESSGPQTIIVPGCDPPLGGCINDEVPLVFFFNIIPDSGTQNPCFASSYIGDVFVFFDGGPTDCSPWRSSSRAKNVNTGCLDIPAEPRWTIGLSKSGALTRITCNAQASIDGFLANVARYRLFIGTSPVNCVDSFTLTRISTNIVGWPFPSTLTVFPI